MTRLQGKVKIITLDFSGCSHSDGGERKSRCTLMTPLGFLAGGFLLLLATNKHPNSAKIPKHDSLSIFPDVVGVMAEKEKVDAP